MTKKPLIGITLDNFDPNHNEWAKYYSKDYWYALRTHYIDAIIQSGGIPFLLPHHLELVEDFASKIDGLMITGGGFDVPPHYYNADVHEKTRLKLRRSEFEKTILERVLKDQKPILGICGGMQLLAAFYGGELFQYLPDEGCFKEHSQTISPHQTWHTIVSFENTKLSNLLGTCNEPIPVNSVHQQAVKNPGTLCVSARSDDDLIEAIEDPTHPFCIGIQWHPEFLISNYDKKIFDGFIKACT